MNLAVASLENARTYWAGVGCDLFGNRDTFWYTLIGKFDFGCTHHGIRDTANMD